MVGSGRRLELSHHVNRRRGRGLLDGRSRLEHRDGRLTLTAPLCALGFGSLGGSKVASKD